MPCCDQKPKSLIKSIESDDVQIICQYSLILKYNYALLCNLAATYAESGTAAIVNACPV